MKGGKRRFALRFYWGDLRGVDGGLGFLRDEAMIGGIRVVGRPFISCCGRRLRIGPTWLASNFLVGSATFSSAVSRIRFLACRANSDWVGLVEIHRTPDLEASIRCGREVCSNLCDRDVIVVYVVVDYREREEGQETDFAAGVFPTCTY